MNEFFTEPGHESGDIKAARPENKLDPSNMKAKTKVDHAPNRHEGVRNEPSHSSNRGHIHHNADK